MVIEAILGVLSGGLGSWVSKGIGYFEKRQDFQHELKLLEMQMATKKAETESELLIAEEASISTLRQASYTHDSDSGKVSRWVSNTLRLTRPVLTIFLIVLVGCIWFTVGNEDASVKLQIIEGVLYMASAALAWWFGDRTPNQKR